MIAATIREATWAPAELYVRAKAAVCPLVDRIRDMRGQTGFEYFLIAGGIAVLIGAAVITFGGAVKDGIDQAKTCLNNASTTAAAAGGAGGSGSVCT